MTKACFLCLGGNEGDRARMLHESMSAIEKRIGQITRCSSIYETAPWGMTGQDFLNQVVRITTQLSPGDVLTEIHAIERELGRLRNTSGYHSRPIDIDLLFYGDRIIHSERLTVPHAHITERRFVLVPLCEIAPEFRHPESGTTIETLLAQCRDDKGVRRFSGSRI